MQTDFSLAMPEETTWRAHETERGRGGATNCGDLQQKRGEQGQAVARRMGRRRDLRAEKKGGRGR